MAINTINYFDLNAHSNFVISPHWKIRGIKKLISHHANNGGTQLLIGYFHPSDILDPATGKINEDYSGNSIKCRLMDVE